MNIKSLNENRKNIKSNLNNKWVGSKISTLQETLNYFKELWEKFIEFLQNKFFSSDKYDQVINDLYKEDVIDDEAIDII